MIFKMASIHGLVYIVIGIFVAVTSYFSELEIFIYIGIIFVLVGIAKLVLLWLSNKKGNKKNHNPASKPYDYSRSSHNTQNFYHNITQNSSTISQNQGQSSTENRNTKALHVGKKLFTPMYFCPRCGLRLTQNFNFCPQCGLKLH